MSYLSSPKRVRERLAYVAMSVLVVWHSIAMVVAAAPESTLTQAARSLLQPYLTLFRLDNNWGFFAPNVPRGRQFRYTIEDAAGTRRSFIPEDKLSRLHPNVASGSWIATRRSCGRPTSTVTPSPRRSAASTPRSIR